MKSVIFQDIFIWKAVSQKLKVGGGKSVRFLKGLFKTYSKINVSHRLRFLVWIKSYNFTLTQMLKLGAETGITWGLSSVSTFWRQNRILWV